MLGQAGSAVGFEGGILGEKGENIEKIWKNLKKVVDKGCRIG